MDPAESLNASDSSKIHGSVPCSVCLEGVSEDGGDRSIAKLKCGHFFHLDCIGSAFNAKGRMQCPNCRHVEQGQWLYANGCFLHEDFVDDFTMDEEEIYTGAANLQFSHTPWCPHQGSHFSFTFEELDNLSNGYAEPVVNMRGGLRVCPYLAVHGLSVGVPSPHVEDFLGLHVGNNRTSSRSSSSRRGGAFHATNRNIAATQTSSSYSNMLSTPYEGTSHNPSNGSFPQPNSHRQHNFGFLVQNPQSLHAGASQSNGGHVFGQVPVHLHNPHPMNAVQNGYMGSAWTGQNEMNVGSHRSMQVPSTDGGSWSSSEASNIVGSGQTAGGPDGVTWGATVENQVDPWTAARIFASQPSSSQWWAWIPHVNSHHNQRVVVPNPSTNAYQTEGQFANVGMFPRPRPASSTGYSEQPVEGPYTWAFSGFHGM